MFLVVVLAASLTGSIASSSRLYAVILVAAAASRIPFDFFVKRVWLGIPFFAGDRRDPGDLLRRRARACSSCRSGRSRSRPRSPGSIGAVAVRRSGSAVSVSLAVLLVLTTPWADLLKSLQAIRVPQVFVLVLSMTYRYIFLFLHTANGMFEARKSRVVGRTERRRAAALDRGHRWAT